MEYRQNKKESKIIGRLNYELSTISDDDTFPVKITALNGPVLEVSFKRGQRVRQREVDLEGSDGLKKLIHIAQEEGVNTFSSQQESYVLITLKKRRIYELEQEPYVFSIESDKPLV